LAAIVVVASIAIGVMVALLASRVALSTRYSRRLRVAGSLLLLCGFSLVLLAMAKQRGVGVEFLLEAVLGAIGWVVPAAIALSTVYLSWRAFAERLLTPGYTCGVLLVTAAFGAAWLTMLDAAGVHLAATLTTDVVWILLPTLLPLTASALAPWSLSRVRHQ
jgi:hypothetical protein